MQSYQALLFPVLLIVIMYAMLIIPQKKREKKTKLMLDSVKEGSEIITIGGISGKVINIKDNDITLESGIEKTKFKIARWAIKEVCVLEEKV